MLIGNRSGMVSGSKIPYVTDGLIAMWDGEWNAGKGKHDDSATKWKDLIGDRDLTVGSTFRWGANFIRNMGFSQCATAANKHIPASQFRTLEVVYRQDCHTLSTSNQTMYLVRDNYSGSTNTGKGLITGASSSVLINPFSSSPQKATGTATYGRVQTATMTYGTANTATDVYLNAVRSTEAKTTLNKAYLTTKCVSVGSTDGPLVGRIYCIRVYDRILTDAEIVANQAVDRVRFRAGITGDPWSLEDPEGYVTSQFTRSVQQVYNNKSLVSVSLPNVTGVTDQAFRGCDKLGSVSLPSVTSVGSNAFYSCTGLKSVSLPNVTSVGGSAFYGCTGLTGDLSFDSLTSFGGSAVFQNCTGVTSVSIPLITTLSSSVFSGCSGLVSVDAPLLSSFGADCFRQCTSLERFNSPHTGVCVFRPEGCKVGNWSFMYDAKLRVYINVSNSGVGGFGNNPWQNISVRCIKLLATDPPCSTATQLTNTTSITSTCRFYVPDEAVDTYKAHAAYASRASYIYPASEFNESDWWVD